MNATVYFTTQDTVNQMAAIVVRDGQRENVTLFPNSQALTDTLKALRNRFSSVTFGGQRIPDCYLA